MSNNLKIKIEADYVILFQGEAETPMQLNLIAKTLADCYLAFPKFKEDSASKEDLQKEVDDLKSKLQKFLDASKEA